MLGDNVLVGVVMDDTAGVDSGAVYLYDGVTGEHLRTFVGSGGGWSHFGQSVAAVGDNVLVGARNGAYLLDGDTGELLQEFHSPDGYSWSFGQNVAAVGGNVLIAAPSAHTEASQSGAAYLFDGQTGELLQTFASPDPDGGDRFGHTVAAVGNNVLIGTSGEDTQSANGGAAYLFDGETGELIRSFIGSGGYFGAVAAAGADVLAGGSQGVSLYNGQSGELLQTFENPTHYSSSFGRSVAAVGGTVLVAAPFERVGNQYSSGVIHVFDIESGDLLQTLSSPDLAPGEQFGQSIDVLGDRVLVGHKSQWTGQSMVQAYLFEPSHFFATATADVHGNYDFSGLKPGTYVVNQVIQGGFRRTLPGEEGGYKIHVAEDGSVSGLDFGNFHNYAPEAKDDRFEMAERTTLEVAVAGVLANDCDENGDSLSAVLVDGPQHGTLRPESDGSFVYTPDDDYAGIDSFTYKASDGDLTSEAATVKITVAHDLGGIHVVEFPHLNPAAGDIWYGFRTTRTALVTLWAQNSDEVTITLYDENLEELAEWTPGTGNQMIEWPAEKGQRFYFRLSGTDSDVNVHLANVIKLDGDRATVFGSDGNDVFKFVAADPISASDGGVGGLDAPLAPVVITINGVEYTIDSSTEITTFTIDGGGGEDRVEIRGSSGDDVLRLRPNSATLIGPGYQVEVTNVGTITVIGGGGNDTAHLYDSAGNDTFVGGPLSSEMQGAGFHNRVEGIATVHGYAKAGGNDVASFYDSAGDDTLIGKPIASKIFGQDYFVRAKFFDAVYAYSTAGGTDVAHLYGSRSSETFVGKTDFAKLSGKGFFYRAESFDYAHGYARQGGTDVAHLYDSAGDDKFVSKPVFAKLFGNGFYNRAKFFDAVHGYAINGGTDTAYLYDSAGDDTFVATPTYAKMFGDRFYSRVKFFDAVHGIARAGGHDTARLYDSAGDDLFVVDGSNATLSGNGFCNRARGFDAISAFANRGGQDQAVLHDTAIQDRLEAAGSLVNVSNNRWTVAARGFSAVRAIGGSGGDDTSSIGVVDFMMTTEGPWSDI